VFTVLCHTWVRVMFSVVRVFRLFRGTLGLYFVYVGGVGWAFFWVLGVFSLLFLVLCLVFFFVSVGFWFLLCFVVVIILWVFFS